MKKFRRLLITAFCFTLTSNAASASTLSKLTSVLLACSSYMLGSQGQAYDSFRKTFGGSEQEEGLGIIAISGGRAVTVGYTRTYGLGEEDALLNIYNTTSGELLISKAIGGLGEEAAYSVQETPDGGFVFVGYTDTAGAGDKDILAVKVNGEVDTIVWAYAYGGAGYEAARSVKHDPNDNGFVIAGFGDSNNNYTHDDALLLKLDSSGTELWGTALVGIHEDVFYDVAIDNAGNYKAVGSTQTYALEHEDALVAEFNGTTGDLTQAYAIFGFDTSARSIAMASDDSFGVAGCIFSEESGYVELFMKFDPSYHLTHIKAFGLGNIDCSALVVKTATGYGVTGSTPRTGGQNHQQSLTEFDENGDIEWFKIIGQNTDEDSGNALAIDEDGSFLVTGILAKDFGYGNYSLLFDKYTADGSSDCGPNGLPTLAFLDLTLSIDIENNPITPENEPLGFTRTDVKAHFTITDIASPFETLECST